MAGFAVGKPEAGVSVFGRYIKNREGGGGATCCRSMLQKKGEISRCAVAGEDGRRGSVESEVGHDLKERVACRKELIGLIAVVEDKQRRKDPVPHCSEAGSLLVVIIVAGEKVGLHRRH